MTACLRRDLTCPECGDLMTNLVYHSGNIWVCPTAINEWVIYPGSGYHVQVEGAKHERDPRNRMRYWTQEDDYIRGQLDALRYVGHGIKYHTEREAA